MRKKTKFKLGDLVKSVPIDIITGKIIKIGEHDDYLVEFDDETKETYCIAAKNLMERLGISKNEETELNMWFNRDEIILDQTKIRNNRLKRLLK